MELFRIDLEKNQLFDLGYIHWYIFGKYTLGYIGDILGDVKHAYESFTKERLDRAVVNNLLKGMFNGVRVEGLAAIC